MIEELTKEQELLLSVYRDKWIEINRSTAPANHAEAEDALNRAYVIAGLEPPKQILWTTSPLAGFLLVSIFKNEKLMKKIYSQLKTEHQELGRPVRNSVRGSVEDSAWNSVWNSVEDSVRGSVWNSVWTSVGESVGDSAWNSVWNSVRNSVWSSVGESVWNSVRNSVLESVWTSVGESVGDSAWNSVEDSVRGSVWNSVWNSVRESAWNSVRNSVEDSVRESVWNSVWNTFRNSVRESVWNSVSNSVGESVWNSFRSSIGNPCFGQQDAEWLAVYDYFLNVLQIQSCSRLIPLMDLARNANWFFPYKKIAIISEKPTDCFLNNGRIHRDLGPSIRYPDGFSVWALNGVRLSQKIVETPAKDLDPKIILKEKNADVRREIIRKIGIDRVIEAMGAETVDKEKDYELLLLDIGDGMKRPYLKMKNPSIDVWHIEGVHPNCKTVSEALAWRNGLNRFKKPEVLT